MSFKPLVNQCIWKISCFYSNILPGGKQLIFARSRIWSLVIFLLPFPKALCQCTLLAETDFQYLEQSKSHDSLRKNSEEPAFVKEDLEWTCVLSVETMCGQEVITSCTGYNEEQIENRDLWSLGWRDRLCVPLEVSSQTAWQRLEPACLYVSGFIYRAFWDCTVQGRKGSGKNASPFLVAS